MRILAVGSDIAPTLATSCAALPPEAARFTLGRPGGETIAPTLRVRGFTLIELLVVLAIMAVATAGVVMALRDGASVALEREALRLTALLESGRAQSRMSASPVRWRVTAGGFEFDGLPGTTLPTHWLSSDVRSNREGDVLLGPEPIIGPQKIVLVSVSDPSRRLTLATDGVHPFAVFADEEAKTFP